MPTITVKNIPIELYGKLKQSAEIHHRSINSEIISLIEQAVSSQKIKPEIMLANARKLREKTTASSISDVELNKAKRDRNDP